MEEQKCMIGPEHLELVFALIGAFWTFYVLSMFCHKPAKPLLGPTQVDGGTTCFVCQGHFINICSTSHQHMFYVSSTYVLLSSTYLLRFIYVSSTRDLRLICEGLWRETKVCSTWVLTRYFSPPSHALSKYMASPNSLLGLAIYLRSTCHLLASGLPGKKCPRIAILW